MSVFHPPISRPSNPRRRQRGAALLLVLVLGVVAFATFLVNSDLLTSQVSSRINSERDLQDLAALAEAKEALIMHVIRTRSARNTILSAPTLGYLPQPDAATSASSEETPARNYDGSRDSGCAHSGWLPGVALDSGFGGGRNFDSLRCLGRLPWRDLGLVPWNGPDQADALGRAIWYGVSLNFVNPACPETFNANMLTAVQAAWPPSGCFGSGFDTGVKRLAWLTVLDERGNVLTNRAAFVLVMPGTPIGGQVRPGPPAGQLAGADAYLDRVVVKPGCTMPCVPGTYRNWDLTLNNATNLRFIACAHPRNVGSTSNEYTLPYQCNDKVVYATIDEIIARAQSRGIL